MSYINERHEELLKKEVKIINFKEFIKKNSDGKFQPYSDLMAVFVNKNGQGCIVDYEGIGFKFDSLNEKQEIDLYVCYDKWNEEHPDERHIAIMPTAIGKFKVKDIIEEPVDSVKTFEDFFTKRNYNDRCARNYDDLISLLNKYELI